MKSRTIKVLFYACLFSIVAATASQARDVTLQWDPSTDTSITGYKINYNADSATTPFSGTGAAQGVSPFDASMVTTATLNGLDPGKSYYFAVTAYNASGAVSPYSNVVNVSEVSPPTVSITAPAANTTISGTVSVTASATDNVGVTKVEYYLNGVLKSTDTSTPYVYSLNTALLASGTYTLMAKAYDAAGNIGQSSNVSVTVVNDTTAPTVSLTTPVNNATVSGTTTITASASDNVGVSKVELYANGVLLSATNVAPFSYNWNTTAVANGSYTIIAKAYDNTGNAAQSGNSTVTVNNQIVAPPVSAGYGFWSSTAVPAVLDVGPESPVQLGVKFRADTNGYITGVRFYKAAGNTGTHVGSLWTATGSRLATANYTAETTSGWQQVDFASPVAITANTVYVASYHTTVGHYSYNSGYFATKGADNAALHALASGVSGSNGVYAYGASTLFPNQSWNNTNYWVDVAFSSTSTPLADTIAPAVAISSPTAGTTVSGTVTVNTTASDNVGVSKVEFYVNSILQGTDTTSPYSFSWNTATLANGSYSLTAKGYDAAGNIGTSSTVSVTVSNTVTTPATYSIWPASVVPAVQDGGADSPVELGVKFRSDMKGYITGIRFYKASTNTGTHIASLWTKRGKRLATATFNNESASGWQQVNFATPVAVAADTVYVASYHTNVGHYGADQNYFSGKGEDNAPLHALADGVSGANSVYAYGTTSTFPNQSHLSTNYWVDVVFKP